MPTTPTTPTVAWRRTVRVGRRPLSTRRGQAQETTRRLVAGSLASLLVLVVVGYVVGAQLAERQVTIDAKHFNSLLAKGLVGPQLTPDLLAGDPDAVDELDTVIRARLVPGSSLRRVKVWSPQGRILYSDERREIGKVFTLTPSQKTALRNGGTVAEVSDLSRRESALERELEPRLLEIYTGVRTSSGRPVLFETYMSYQQIREQREAVFTMLSLLAVVGVVMFAGCQVGLGLVNLRWVRRQQAELDERALQVSDRARQRLARDLHDGPVQDLVGASYVVAGALQSIRGRQLPETERLLEGAASSVSSSIQSLRSVMIEVYPRSLHGRGLSDALNDIAQPMRTRGLDVDVAVVLEQSVSPETTEAIFRTVQEAVRNVMNHAVATSTQIRVAERGEFVLVTVTDDGIGLPTTDIRSPAGHLGLLALADIAVERHGSLEIWSSPGQGTQVRMELRR